MSRERRPPGHPPFFVYGTLLPRQPNYYRWGNSIQSSRRAVMANGRLYDMGYYPMLVEEAGHAVQGMVMAVRDDRYARLLRDLDALEGFDPERPEADGYRRVERPVSLPDGQVLLAWVYVGQPSLVSGMTPIEDGDWAAYASARTSIMAAWWQSMSSVAGLHRTSEEKNRGSD